MRLLMCYNRTAITPGRYLEDGLRKIGVEVDVQSTEIDFRRLDLAGFSGVLFVESPSRSPLAVHGAERVSIPKLFWVHHGANRVYANVDLCKQFLPDLVLMAHSLELAERFPAPVRFFPFAMAADIFNCNRPLSERRLDIAFAGSTAAGTYDRRRAALRAISKHFSQRKISLYGKVYLHKLAALYGNAKIVVNCVADELRSLNMRIFEGMGCGALVLTDLVPHQERLFKDGKHYVVYHDIDDLIDKLGYYLDHLEEAQQIASQGYHYLLSRHTYEHRARELCAMIRELSSTSNSS